MMVVIDVQHKEAKASIIELFRNDVAIFIDDNGHSDHKSLSFNEKGQIIGIKTPSKVGNEKDALTDMQGKLVDAYVIEERTYACNRNLPGNVDVSLDSYQFSNENVALFANSVEALKLWDKKIVLGTTLPFKRMNVDSNNEKVKSAFKKKVKRARDKSQLKILDHVIMREGELCYYDWAIGWDGKINSTLAGESKTRNVLNCDIGGGTTDIVSITTEGLQIAADGSSSDTIESFGIHKLKGEVEQVLKRLLAQKIANPFSKGIENFAPKTINDALTKGFINYPGLAEPLDVSVEVNECKEQFCNQLIRRMLDIVERLDSFDLILFSGGGAIILREQLNALLPGSIFLDEFANARGMLKAFIFNVMPRRKEAWISASKELVKNE